LFASAAIASNVNLNRKRSDTGHLSCDWCPYLDCLTKRLKDFQGLTALEVFCFYASFCFTTRLKPWHESVLPFPVKDDVSILFQTQS
jgi:hypothetical protein